MDALPQLKVVWLMQNKLKGPLPMGLALLPSLKILWCQDNDGLTGGEELRAQLAKRNGFVNVNL
jgi:hypothetical protein